ncbi:type II secretion system minor pseudopilin GspI [Sphingomonas sp. LHG3406-1]|uniref:type II secretion system minor pseudopilin GspI n=1 Tax=Sphingomonas sp. LHG3406-1 TaxID=2804617 RepID=UPI00260A27A1|nr:type II secretion system minor pseudopilin GspI [Sphingomonas sp. LHG3406-1]
MTRNGFTLLELLVALAVFSIAALALLRLDAVAVATTADLAAREGAMLTAENEAARLLTDPGAPTIGSADRNVSNGGRQFLVRETISPTPDKRLVRIDLAVRDAQGGGQAALTLFRRVP